MSQRHRPSQRGTGGLAVAASLAAMLLTATSAGSQTYLDGGGGSSSRPQTSDPTGGFLDGGGPLQRRSGTRAGNRRGGFLDDGGNISTRPDIVIGSGRDEEFLRDGGSITTAPDIVFSDEREEFLEDGGSITVEPNVLIDGRHLRGGRGWQEVAAPRTYRRSSGSFTVITSDIGDRQVRTAAYAPADGINRTRPRAKVIDVESMRLDNRPMPASGIEVIYKIGGPKIIRIAPGYGQRVAATDTDRAMARPTPRASPPSAPWTREWLDRCTREHESFDPDYGTYVDASGQSQFCD
ncbi:hypothetical protein VQ042_06865 [Aurantimonas sp. A2-1-M11]|uniref:hypothetical protein n=1 Tax=Aurantimonas sp. A2-1-M11 TaxID=3113712 RepID=UPI002F93DEDB